MNYTNKYGKKFEILSNTIEGTGFDEIKGIISIKGDDNIENRVEVQIVRSLSNKWRLEQDQEVAIFNMIAKIAIEKADFNNKVYDSDNTKNCYSFNDFMNLLSKEFVAAKEKKIGFK